MTTTATHPFMTFSFNTKCIDSKTWMLLGEAMSKCQHMAGTPLKPHAADDMYAVYLARGVQATTAIEGNTLSTQEVKDIVRKGSADVSESRQYLEREVQNVLSAVRDIDVALRSGLRQTISADRLKGLNYQVLNGIPDKPEVVPGEYRHHDVAAGTYRAPHYPEVPHQVDRLVAWLDELRSSIGPDSSDEDRFVNAILSAILAHLYVAWIHPFGNGNGRVARLMEVQILSESGVVPMVATNLLSDHYNKTRNNYYLALDEAQRDVGAFVKYAVRGFVDELRDQIKVVRRESLAIHWESYVHEVFGRVPNTDARARQRTLALSLPQDREVTPEEITELTTRLAKQYAVCGERTPARDLNTLVKLDLVQKTNRRHYRARRELIEAFLPPVSTVTP